MTLMTIGFIIFTSFTLTCGVRGQDDDSLAGSFFSGLFDSLTKTAEPAECPGVCVNALATLICDEVLEDIECPTVSMRCCVNGPLNSTETSLGNDIPGSRPTSTEKPITMGHPASTTLFTTTTTTTTTTTVPTATTSPSATSTAATTVVQRKPEKPSNCSEATREGAGGDKGVNTVTTTQEPKLLSQRSCKGECNSGFYALFCDNIDNEADCPDGGFCCISDPPIEDEATVTTTPHNPTKPVQEKITSPTIVQSTATPGPPTKRPGQLPPCKGVCTEPFFSIFCEKPSTIISRTSTCKSGFICCEASDSSSVQSQFLSYRRLRQRISAAKVNVPLMLGSYAGESDFSISPTCSVAPWLIECIKWTSELQTADTTEANNFGLD